MESIMQYLFSETDETRSFSLSSNYRGNAELTDKLFGNWNRINVSEEVASDLNIYGIKPDSDFAKFMTILHEFFPGTSNIGIRVGGPIRNCAFFLRGYEDIIKNFQNPKHTGFGVMNYETTRIVLGRAEGDKNYILSYIPSTKKYLITAEYNSWNLIGRGVDKLFKGDKFEKVLETREFKKALEFYKTLTIVND